MCTVFTVVGGVSGVEGVRGVDEELSVGCVVSVRGLAAKTGEFKVSNEECKMCENM